MDNLRIASMRPQRNAAENVPGRYQHGRRVRLASMRPQRNAAENQIRTQACPRPHHASMRPQRNAAENRARLQNIVRCYTVLQ